MTCSLLDCLGSIEINWTALSSIATFAAVMVALWPIFGEKSRRKALARNLRARLLTQLTLLRPIVASRFTDTPRDAKTDKPLTEKELEPVRALEAMLPQAVILDSEEHDRTVFAFTNLSLLRHMKKIEPQMAENILKLIDEAKDELEKGEWLQGKMPELSWNKKKEKS